MQYNVRRTSPAIQIADISKVTVNKSWVVRHTFVRLNTVLSRILSATADKRNLLLLSKMKISAVLVDG